jgi:ubiquinone/menaquinone biosynthesis C-methylase UbiE
MANMLNFGCADVQPKNWCNLDVTDHGQEYVADVVDGLPFDDDYFDCAVANHALHMLNWEELTEQALPELCRVLRPGGVLRIIEMDPVRAFHAYISGDDESLVVPDEWALSIDAKFCQYLTWFGTRNNICTGNYLVELLTGADFAHAALQAPGVTMYESKDILELDSRAAESFFAEARK